MAVSENKARIRGRLRGHKRKKANLWTHCSIFEVWDNIRETEILELKGILRHLYRKDLRANNMAVQKGFNKLHRIHYSSKQESWLRSVDEREQENQI